MRYRGGKEAAIGDIVKICGSSVGKALFEVIDILDNNLLYCMCRWSVTVDYKIGKAYPSNDCLFFRLKENSYYKEYPWMKYVGSNVNPRIGDLIGHISAPCDSTFKVVDMLEDFFLVCECVWSNGDCGYQIGMSNEFYITSVFKVYKEQISMFVEV